MSGATVAVAVSFLLLLSTAVTARQADPAAEPAPLARVLSASLRELS